MAKFKSLNIGDTVRVVSLADTGVRCGDPGLLDEYIGGTFEVTHLTRQPSSGLGRVKLSNGWWFSPKGLEVLTSSKPTVATAPTGDEYGECTTCIEPTPEPVVHAPDDFKYTRVRVKDTGAEGVVVGRSERGLIAVLHDSESDCYHSGTLFSVGFVGVPNRILFYLAEQLEIIGGIQ